MFPEVQARAQAEIDAVVGPDRLPNFGDRESLPYVEALCKENYRFFNTVPLGIDRVAHCDSRLTGAQAFLINYEKTMNITACFCPKAQWWLQMSGMCWCLG